MGRCGPHALPLLLVLLYKAPMLGAVRPSLQHIHEGQVGNGHSLRAGPGTAGEPKARQRCIRFAIRR